MLLDGILGAPEPACCEGMAVIYAQACSDGGENISPEIGMPWQTIKREK